MNTQEEKENFKHTRAWPELAVSSSNTWLTLGYLG